MSAWLPTQMSRADRPGKHKAVVDHLVQQFPHHQPKRNDDRLAGELLARAGLAGGGAALGCSTFGVQNTLRLVLGHEPLRRHHAHHLAFRHAHAGEHAHDLLAGDAFSGCRLHHEAHLRVGHAVLPHHLRHHGNFFFRHAHLRGNGGKLHTRQLIGHIGGDGAARAHAAYQAFQLFEHGSLFRYLPPSASTAARASAALAVTPPLPVPALLSCCVACSKPACRKRSSS